MARTAFYNDNANRDYPFLKDSTGSRADSQFSLMPFATIVDFGCLMGLRSEYVEGEHNVWLRSVWRVGDVFRFEFRSDAPGLADQLLSFYFQLSDDRYSTQYVESEHELREFSLSESLNDSISGCPDDSLWSGYMVIGDLRPLAAILPDDGILFGEALIEPALIRSLVGAYARTINLGNKDRTRATNPEDCRPLCWDFPIGGVFVRDLCLAGHVRFQPGYNCQITEDSLNNAIIIGAVLPTSADNAMGPPCEEVPVFEGETPPQGRTRLDGALACHEVFKSVNGVGGRTVDIRSGYGVNIEHDADNHTIIIDVNLHNLAVCQNLNNQGGEEDDENCASVSESYDPCRCGPLE